MPKNMMKSFKTLGAAGAAGLTLVVTGCAGSYGANEMQVGSVGEAATVREGMVVAVRPVQIEAGNNNRVIGTVLGAALGGLAGSQVGGGDAENAAGAVIGATAGGVLGNEVAKGTNRRPGYAYTIDFGDGQLKEITQGADVYIEPGRRVFVTFYTDRVRVAPAGY